MSKPIIFIDTETGGLYPSQHALLSIGVCTSWGAPPLTLYITADSQPGKTVDPEAAAINGYTPEKWAERGAMPLHEAMTKLATELRALKAHRRYARLVAHHHAFDRGFLDEAARICEIDLPGRYDWRCSMLLMGELMDEGLLPWGSLSLKRLGELSGQWPAGERPDVHDVAEDARVGLAGYQWLLDLRTKKERGAAA